MNTTTRNLSLRSEAERRQALALAVWERAIQTYQADPSNANREHMIAAAQRHDQAKRDTRSASMTYKYTKGTVTA